MIETLFLRGYPFQGIEGANAALLGWLIGREPGGSEGKDRLVREQAALRPLPTAPFAPVRLRLAGKSEA